MGFDLWGENKNLGTVIGEGKRRKEWKVGLYERERDIGQSVGSLSKGVRFIGTRLGFSS